MASYQALTCTRATPISLATLNAALKAVDPTIGASVPAAAVLMSGTVTLKKNTPWTAPEIAAAQTILDTAAELDPADRDVDQKVLKALAQGLWECIPNPTMTKAQLRTRIIAIWRTL